MAFPFEKFILYQKSIAWLKEAHSICRDAKGAVPHSILDQLFRASTSIPFNVAEGCGKWLEKDRRNFYRIARGSVFECVPAIEILRVTSAITEERYQKSYALLEEIGKMLTSSIKRSEEIS